jgi:hypothetical protein
MENKSIYAKLIEIQSELNVPKNLYNSFGKYKYRNCESILEVAKPICKKHGAVLILNDDIELVGDRFYIKATATLTDGKEAIEVHAYAREEENKKGMDGSQITGTASSYARKYALGGLFNLDDNKDADTDEFAMQTKKSNPVICPKCGKEIQGITTKNGTYWSPENILKKYECCSNCYKKSKVMEALTDEH